MDRYLRPPQWAMEARGVDRDASAKTNGRNDCTGCGESVSCGSEASSISREAKAIVPLFRAFIPASAIWGGVALLEERRS